MRFKQRPKTASFIFVIIAMSVFPASEALSITIGEITHTLTCTCGCNMVVGACEGTMECTAAKHITDQVAQLIDDGQSKDEIIGSLVKIYGERILAEPTKKGFNLTAWIFPLLVVLLGGVGIYIFINRCLGSRKKPADGFDSSDQKQTFEQRYLDQFENELKDYRL